MLSDSLNNLEFEEKVVDASGGFGEVTGVSGEVTDGERSKP